MGVSKREFSGGIDVDVILDTCSTIEIMICYHKDVCMYVLSSHIAEYGSTG